MKTEVINEGNIPPHVSELTGFRKKKPGAAAGEGARPQGQKGGR